MPYKPCLLNKLQMTSRFLRTGLAKNLREEGLYPGQENVLLVLFSKGELTLGQLAAELDVRPPTITKTILRLANQGFVQKTASNDDHRQTIVSLTKKGIDIVDRLEIRLDAIEKTALSGINSDEIQVLIDLLDRIEGNLA